MPENKMECFWYSQCENIWFTTQVITKKNPYIVYGEYGK